LLDHKAHGITSRYFHSADAVLLAAADAVADAAKKLMEQVVIDLKPMGNADQPWSPASA
jgi:hypothetical protein